MSDLSTSNVQGADSSEEAVSPYAGMDPAFALNMHKLMTEVNGMGGNLDLMSGYRSPVDQENFYNNAVAQVGPADASKFAAIPSQSNHTKGIAGDLSGNARSLNLAQQLAGKYGITFPLQNEPWHAEQAGAAQLHDNQGGPLDHPVVQNNILSNGAPGSLGDALLAASAQMQMNQQNPQQSTQQGQPAPTVGAGIPAKASSPGGDNEKSNQRLGQQMAKQYGWDQGDEWNALNAVVMRESGWNSTIANKSSGALGIGQSLGHGGDGTNGSLGNEYGGQGLTNQEAQAANSGDPNAQITWTYNYIKSRYGDPQGALAHEQQFGWY